MLFKETLDRLTWEVKEAVDEIFTTIDQRQTHPNDIVLPKWGWYSEQRMDGYKPFGPGLGGWDAETEHTQYEFYDSYRRQYVKGSRKVFYTKISSDQKAKKDIRLSIQMELMLYLRFWETDRILTKLFHYTQLALGKPFNWQYKLDPDKKNHLLIREEIRDPLKQICPKYYALLKKMYKSQIRNAVAHSQYYITDNHVGFTNYAPAKHAPFAQESYDWWEEIFHTVILFYNELIAHEIAIEERAKRLDQLSVGAGIEIRYTDPSIQITDIVHWCFDHQRNMWSWGPPRSASGLYL
ncbi:MAG: hypothetical protein H6592_14395 [Flavobacteriales bacterium]|nr:hypothetical protein [Flavobacteriales bacterium]